MVLAVRRRRRAALRRGWGGRVGPSFPFSVGRIRRGFPSIHAGGSVRLLGPIVTQCTDQNLGFWVNAVSRLVWSVAPNGETVAKFAQTQGKVGAGADDPIHPVGGRFVWFAGQAESTIARAQL